MILCEVYPDSSIDKTNEVGTLYNRNGISFIKSYVEKAMPSLIGKSVRCAFLDDDRTELCGHGDTGIEDGIPIFEDASVIGHFIKVYISEVIENDESHLYLIGEAELDGQCYHNFISKLEENIANDTPPKGSVEIMRTSDNEGIIYKYGYKAVGRIPEVFDFSGYALLGILESDPAAKAIELNSKEDKKIMDEAQVKALVGEVVQTTMNVTAEMNKCKEECATQVAAASEAVADKDKKIDELNDQIDKLKAELEACNGEKSELNSANEALQSEVNSLKDTVAESEKKEKIGELNAAIAYFTDEEKEYAKAEIEAFNADPIASEVNSVVAKIWEGVGKKAKADAEAAAAVAAEQNASKANLDDIFSEVGGKTTDTEDMNIF